MQGSAHGGSCGPSRSAATRPCCYRNPERPRFLVHADRRLSTRLNLTVYMPVGRSIVVRRMMTLTQEAKPSLRSILIVDDDDGVRENLAELFDVVGYRVITAANANEALDHLGQESVDVLLTDYRMPGPNGVELIEAARRAKPGLKAVLMTAFGDSFTEIESVPRGAIGYLNKPFEADEITGLVARILSLKRE